MKRSALIVNLFAGPGAGKSTTAAQVFSELKVRGVSCEMALEWAKEKVWEKSFNTMSDQVYVFAKQYHHIWRLADQVDVVITDSPLPFTLVYDGEKRPKFFDFVMDEFSKFKNINFYIERSTKYDPAGRQQTAEEAAAIDAEMLRILEKYGVPYESVTKEDAKTRITDRVLGILNSEREKNHLEEKAETVEVNRPANRAQLQSKPRLDKPFKAEPSWYAPNKPVNYV